MAHATTTLTGTFARPAGAPGQGTAKITPSRSPIVDPDGQVIMVGSDTFPLDQDGRLSVSLPSSDDPTLGEPFTYSVTVAMYHGYWSTTGLALPAAETTVDLASVPSDRVVHYLTADEVQELLSDLPDPVTVSPTPPAGGLWVDSDQEA